MFGKSLARDNRPASEILNEALTVAKDADVIVAALGEAAEMTGEAVQPERYSNSRITKRPAESTGKNRQAGCVGVVYRPPSGNQVGK